MDSITLTEYIVMGFIVLIILFSAFNTSRRFFRSKNPNMKTPNFRGKSVLIDDDDFGRAVASGYEPTSPVSGFVSLVSQNGVAFKQHYHVWDVEPIHVLEALAGTERAVYRVKGKRTGSVDAVKISHEAELAELASKIKKQKIDQKVEVNEAATLKDMVMDMVKEVKEEKKSVEIGKLK